jgi:hypothetical protein
MCMMTRWELMNGSGKNVEKKNELNGSIRMMDWKLVHDQGNELKMMFWDKQTKIFKKNS